MNDTARTVVTHIDVNTEIDYFSDFNETLSEYFYELSINGIKLNYYGDDKRKRCLKDYNKLLTKGAKQVYHEAYIGEQEKAHWEAVAQQNADPKQHGHVKYSILAGENSCCYVWDYYQQKTVRKEELTNV